MGHEENEFSREMEELERISSVSISVLVNGSPIKDFGMARGLPQVDPLFPFLFPIVTEGLNSIVKSSVDLGLIKEYQVVLGENPYPCSSILMTL